MDFSTASGILFTMAVGVAVGTDVTWQALTRTLSTSSRPFICGMVCQFILMPLYATLFTYIFEDAITKYSNYNYSSSVLGILVVGCLPGGSTSNLFTYFVNGNVPLSIVMSLVSNVAALFFMPLCLYLLYELRFENDAQAVKIPYVNLIIPMLLSTICIGVGMLCKAFLSADMTWWVSKCCSIFSLFFLFLALVVGFIQYSEILTNGDWSLILVGITLQPVGYVFGLTLGRVARLGLRDIMTIAFETGVQSFALGMALAQLSFDKDKPQEEDVFVDVFKYSALCGIFYAVHAAWLVLGFRKLLPRGLWRVSAYYPEETWKTYPHKRHTEESLQATAEAVPILAEPPSCASAENFPPQTLPQLFDLACAKHPKRLALTVERNIPKDEDGKLVKALPWKDWSKYTYAQYRQEVHRVAAALVSMGVQQFGTVTINGFNAPEWSISALGVIHVGAKICGIYSTDTDDNIIWKTVHSAACVALIDSSPKAKWHQDKSADMPTLKTVVCWDSAPLPEVTEAWNIQLHSFANFLTLGQETLAKTPNCVKERVDKLKPGHCAALVYTSGTSGKPKAVMISHDNLTFSSQMVTHVLRDCVSVSEGEEGRVLSYLPLSHIAGFMIDITFPIVVTSRTRGYIAVYFARKTDLRDGTLVDRLKMCRPTIFFGVPRVWEKLEEKMKAIGEKTKGWFCCFRKKAVAKWAKHQGELTAVNRQVGGNGRTSAFFGLAEAMVLDNVKAAIGLDECRAFASGAAPLSPETKRYFGSLAIIITECYGMSESTGMGVMASETRYHPKAIGWRMPGTQIKILSQDGKGEVGAAADFDKPTEQEQGEICLRGRHVMMGYFMNKALGHEHVTDILNQTLNTIDEEGWLHTGDKGCMSSTGLYRITGRFKELIIGAGGENVAPVPIENKIKEVCPAISNVMMVGDHRKYNVAVVTLKVEGADGESPGTEVLAGLAKEVNPNVKTTREAMTDQVWKDYVQKGIDAANGDQTVCPNNASKVQKFTILPKEFSIQGGEFTPSLKLRRSVAAEIWVKEIDALY